MTYRREDPQHGAAAVVDTGGVGGLTTVGLGSTPTNSSEPEAIGGGPPREVTCIKLYLLPLSKPLHETKQKFTKF